MATILSRARRILDTGAITDGAMLVGLAGGALAGAVVFPYFILENRKIKGPTDVLEVGALAVSGGVGFGYAGGSAGAVSGEFILTPVVRKAANNPRTAATALAFSLAGGSFVAGMKCGESRAQRVIGGREIQKYNEGQDQGRGA